MPNDIRKVLVSDFCDVRVKGYTVQGPHDIGRMGKYEKGVGYLYGCERPGIDVWFVAI